MGKKGGSKHLKRKPAPRFWPIHRKEHVWAVKPKPGPHSLTSCLPLAMVVRDILGFAETRREAKAIISMGKVLVDGKPTREASFPVGLMDIISIPEAKAVYRILSHRKGLILHPIEKVEAKYKLCRIEDKTVVNHGHIQLNLHDGSNRMAQVSASESPGEVAYRTLDVVKVEVSSGEISGQIKLSKGATILITGGKNRGVHGKLVDIEEAAGKKRRLTLATIEDSAGKRYQTILDFVFAVGDSEQQISLPEVD